MTTTAEVLGALEGVRDPELDQNLVELGFVADVDVDEKPGRVSVHLRLPTYYCAPNFAFLMVADARAAVEALPGVRAAHIALDDHFTAKEVTDAVARGDGFGRAFPGEAHDDLGELRTLFQRKAFAARQSRICDALLAEGRTYAELAEMRLGDLPPGEDADRVRELRAALGLDARPEAPAIVAGDGSRVTAADLHRLLRMGRLVALSLEGNAGLCRGLLATRYGLTETEQEGVA